MESSLQSAGLLEQMKIHLSTDAGKEITKKIGLVYQLNIAPKVPTFKDICLIIDISWCFPFVGCRGAMKIKGSISAAQKFTPDIFPKPSKL
ncbi:hypothetical protein B296_00008644 [Ensete ventricosum]|uniref:Uncharacterized protein n=1 Tax=Ensete ventricosum TaxID=4639 RepID=A0A427AXW6_ENSVE|nr:hypothetical protein B296_00008644 [Ensete ventricosum]